MGERRRVKRWTLALATFIWLVIWQIAAMLMAKPLLLPSPLQTVERLFALAMTVAFWQTAGLTLVRVMSGYLAALLIGAVLAALCAAFSPVEVLLAPVRSAIKATPVSSFIILVMLWLAVGVVPAFISFLMVLPIVWTNVQNGIESTDGGLLEMAKSYGFGRLKTLRHVYAPSVLPHFLAACSSGLGFAWKSGVAAEVIARPKLSIGGRLQDAKIYIETPDLFAWTLLVILLSMALERLVLLLVRRLSRERRRSDDCL